MSARSLSQEVNFPATRVRGCGIVKRVGTSSPASEWRCCQFDSATDIGPGGTSGEYWPMCRRNLVKTFANLSFEEAHDPAVGPARRAVVQRTRCKTRLAASIQITGGFMELIGEHRGFRVHTSWFADAKETRFTGAFKGT